MEERIGRADYQTDAPLGGFGRLVARKIHDGRGFVAHRSRSIRAALRGRFNLSRQPHRELVPDRSDRAFRSRSAEGTATGPEATKALLPAVSDQGGQRS